MNTIESKLVQDKNLAPNPIPLPQEHKGKGEFASDSSAHAEMIKEMQETACYQYSASTVGVGNGQYTCRFSQNTDFDDEVPDLELRLDNGKHLPFWLSVRVPYPPRRGQQILRCQGRFEFLIDGKTQPMQQVSLLWTPDTGVATLVSPTHDKPLLTFTLQYHGTFAPSPVYTLVPVPESAPERLSSSLPK
jgi:hypothetical protein